MLGFLLVHGLSRALIKDGELIGDDDGLDILCRVQPVITKVDPLLQGAAVAVWKIILRYLYIIQPFALVIAAVASMNNITPP